MTAKSVNNNFRFPFEYYTPIAIDGPMFAVVVPVL